MRAKKIVNDASNDSQMEMMWWSHKLAHKVNDKWNIGPSNCQVDKAPN